MRMAVLVTTYGRRDYLQRCLDSLLSQERLPDEIVIVTRVGDAPTEELVGGLLQSYSGPVSLCHGRVEEPGVLAANRVGMKLVTADTVSFIDDDARAHPDWLARIEKWFESDPTIGAVGGRDITHTDNGIVAHRARTVARIYWYGRIVGNHESIYPRSSEAQHLKGVNMSFRRELMAPFDELILGNAHHYETDLCFAVRNSGYRIIFDGRILVDHFVDAPRHLSGNQAGADVKRKFFMHHNRVYVMLKNLDPGRSGAFLFYTFVIDGVSELARIAARRPGTSLAILGSMYRGKIAGLKDYARARWRKRRANPRND